MNINNIISFLTDLKSNNNREWFAENKDRYLQVKTDFDKISEALINEIALFDEEIKHVQAKDCIFRIYRDTRFSHDKTPYKTHFGVYIASNGGRKSQRAGYYFHLDPEGSFVSTGIWCPEPKLLKILRQSVYDNIDEFNEITHDKQFSKLFDSFYEEDKLKNVPPGFPKDFPDAELLKLKHYLVNHSLSDEELNAKNVVDVVAELCKTAYPFNCFLNYAYDESNELT